MSLVVTARRGGRLAAFALFYLWRSTMYLRLAGFDYPLLTGAFEYFNVAFYVPGRPAPPRPRVLRGAPDAQRRAASDQTKCPEIGVRMEPVPANAVAVGDPCVLPGRYRMAAMGELTGSRANPRAATRLGALSRRGRAMVPPSSAGRRLVAMSLVNATGSGLWLTGSALFFTRVVGVTAAQDGGLPGGGGCYVMVTGRLRRLLAGVAGLLTTMPVGTLVDRFGPRPVCAVLLLWRTGGFVAYAFTRGFVGFLVIACLLGVADRVMGPVTQSLVSTAVGPDQRNRTMGYVQATRNAGSPSAAPSPA